MAKVESPTSVAGDMATPENATQVSALSSNENASNPAAKPASNGPPMSSVPNFPPPKTDKPRPHVCTTCTRSFARLEHLKRHERSHTKEKPFECQLCTRCFARRDLLLRHQQKLHSTTTPSSRPRNARRESTAGVASGRVRKNSVASTTTTPARPRANTLSHVDTSNSGLASSGAFGRQFLPIHNHNHSFAGLATTPSFGFRGLSATGHPTAAGLPRLETTGLPTDFSSGLRTAPPFGGFGAELEMSPMGFDMANGNTINPHALHMHGMQSFSMDKSFDLMSQMHSGMPSSQSMMDDSGFDWMAQGFDDTMAFSHANENAIDDSSPSAMSTNSPNAFNEAAMQTSNGGFVEAGHHLGAPVWQSAMAHVPHVINSPMSMDVSSFFADGSLPMTDTISPKSLLAQKGPNIDMNFSTPPDLSTLDPATIAAMSASVFTLPFKTEHVASTASSASMDSSQRQSSVTTTSSELVSDHMRNMLINGLSQSTGFGQRKQSQPMISSPLSPSNASKKGFNAALFPTTQDLQRYVSAYIKYFHPHLPFLHTATLNFESSEYSLARNLSNSPSRLASNMAAGGSCLMLSVAALGALFEEEMAHSQELFECAKRLISICLEERRKANVNKGPLTPFQRSEREDTPLWLVQAMLLNVIYGHNCGDKTAADIASNHCAALVSLARGAELAKPYPIYNVTGGFPNGGHHHNMHNNNISPDGWNILNIENNDSDWYEWKVMEERKRTLYTIFILSSLLVTAYNRAPALTNSEIRLDLPCEEELWAADSAQAWRALGGGTTTEAGSVQFATALTHLLTAAQRQRRSTVQQKNGDGWVGQEPELRPSSFGCLILINALHNYIWETRQRHLGRQWTPQEIDAMHAHIEPALRSWSSAWNSNPTHAIERPNPFGVGPLSADSIPLLDLAYVRLFVDFGRSKEAYWQRDYDAMAKELAKGSESDVGSKSDLSDGSEAGSAVINGISSVRNGTQQQPGRDERDDAVGSHPTQRERHLRKAAFYAADHLITSDRLGVGIDERNARELPMQSILCACDSAQVLAEWAATVQERVGEFVGVLGRDQVDLMQLPSVLLLDDEDRKLLSNIDELVNSMEAKQGPNAAISESHEGGFGSRILIVTSQAIGKAAVWPVTKLMARSLETQAGHIKARILASTQVYTA